MSSDDSVRQSPEVVELRPAFAWDCPDCGRECFARTFVADINQAEAADLEEKFGEGTFESGFFLSKPQTVKCMFCGLVFKTEEM